MAGSELYPYVVCFRFPDGHKFQVTTFDVYLMLGAPIGGKKIAQISKSYFDKEYQYVHIALMKERGIDQNNMKLTRMSDFIFGKTNGRESYKRNFIIYLVNYFFSGLKNHYCSKSFLKNVKDVNPIASLNWCQFTLDKMISSVRHYKESKAAKGGVLTVRYSS